METSPVWSLPKRLLFRFAFCYFLLYAMPENGRMSLLLVIPGAAYYMKIWHAIVPWVATNVFHVTGQAATYFPTGSGDTTLGYIQNLLFVLVAAAATIVWSLLDRRRPNYDTLHFWLRILLRYTLAVILFGYGFVKVFPLQFPPPGLLKLTQPLGDFSPMGVLWNFMGASMPYVIFTGTCEVLGGLLLLFRRTTTLGALVSAAVMVNVVALNFCYDVPVKLYSINILLMAVALAAPDVPRLLDVFVRNRPAPAADLGSFGIERRWLRVTLFSVKMLVVTVLFAGRTWGGLSALKVVQNAMRPPLYGLYDVVKFDPPRTPRWMKLAIERPDSLQVRTADDTVIEFAAGYVGSMVFVDGTYRWTWSRPDGDHVQIEGSLDGAPVSITLRKIDTEGMRINRGFHWINEYPFNR